MESMFKLSMMPDCLKLFIFDRQNSQARIKDVFLWFLYQVISNHKAFSKKNNVSFHNECNKIIILLIDQKDLRNKVCLIKLFYILCLSNDAAIN